MNSLSNELINALARLDDRLPDLGLYSCYEHQTPAGKTHPFWKIEWEMALWPRLKELGCSLQQQPVFGKTKFRIFQPLYTSLRFRTPEGKV